MVITQNFNMSYSEVLELDTSDFFMMIDIINEMYQDRKDTTKDDDEIMKLFRPL